MTTLHTLEDLLADQLRDIYDAEQQLATSLPAMAVAAHDEDLKKAFNHHLEETRDQISRLHEIFRDLGIPAVGKHCKAMAGLIRESEEVLEASGDPDVIDAALIAAAQRIEHYEIAAYGTVKAFAKRLDHKHAAGLIEKSLEEEGNADKKLTKLAEGSLMHRSINKEAART